MEAEQLDSVFGGLYRVVAKDGHACMQKCCAVNMRSARRVLPGVRDERVSRSIGALLRGALEGLAGKSGRLDLMRRYWMPWRCVHCLIRNSLTR